MSQTIRVFEALDLNRKIQCIKHIRQASGLPLKQAKDVVDELYQGRSQNGIEIRVKDNYTDAEFDELAKWFEYQRDDGSAPKGTLKLFRVIFTDNGNTYSSVVLATQKPLAIESAEEEMEAFFMVSPSPSTVITCEEVTSFRNGQVLLMSRL